jgi:hypothetical protein
MQVKHPCSLAAAISESPTAKWKKYEEEVISSCQIRPDTAGNESKAPALPSHSYSRINQETKYEEDDGFPQPRT